MHHVRERALPHSHHVDLDGIEIAIQVPGTPIAGPPHDNDCEEQKTAQEPKLFPDRDIFQRISQHVHKP
jgi:hypothetical protein